MADSVSSTCVMVPVGTGLMTPPPLWHIVQPDGSIIVFAPVARYSLAPLLSVPPTNDTGEIPCTHHFKLGSKPTRLSISYSENRSASLQTDPIPPTRNAR
jgi:hypothetical protein